ncbi:MAG: hypothetical protein ACRCXZ_07175 [Patescibacteria group bacterium]
MNDNEKQRIQRKKSKIRKIIKIISISLFFIILIYSTFGLYDIYKYKEKQFQDSKKFNLETVNSISGTYKIRPYNNYDSIFYELLSQDAYIQFTIPTITQLEARLDNFPNIMEKQDCMIVNFESKEDKNRCRINAERNNRNIILTIDISDGRLLNRYDSEESRRENNYGYSLFPISIEIEYISKLKNNTFDSKLIATKIYKDVNY